MLKSFVLEHGAKHRDQLVALGVQWIDAFAADYAIVSEKFEPHLRFVSLLQRTADLRVKLRVTERARDASRTCAATDVPERSN